MVHYLESDGFWVVIYESDDIIYHSLHVYVEKRDFSSNYIFRNSEIETV